MALSHPTDIAEVKVGYELSFDGDSLTDQTGTYTAADDHFRFLVYELLNSGGETLVFTSAKFSSLPQTLTIADTSVPASFELAVEADKTYRVDVVAYDYGESVSYVEDEYYLYARPDIFYTQGSLVTTSGDAVSTAVDQLTLDKLLHALGRNVVHAQFDNESGYTTRRVVRGYDSLTEAQADAKLLEEDTTKSQLHVNPGDDGVTYKHVTNLTVSDEGRERVILEQEQDVT